MVAPQVNYADMISLAKEGSPMLINSVARLAGLGETERKALTTRGVPGWAWGVLGCLVGVALGARAYKSYPDNFPDWVVGKK